MPYEKSFKYWGAVYTSIGFADLLRWVVAVVYYDMSLGLEATLYEYYYYNLW